MQMRILYHSACHLNDLLETDILLDNNQAILLLIDEKPNQLISLQHF